MLNIESTSSHKAGYRFVYHQDIKANMICQSNFSYEDTATTSGAVIG